MGERRMLICSDVKSSRTSWPRGQHFVLGREHLSSARPVNFLFWPRVNESDDGTGSYHCEFAVIIYQSYLLTSFVLSPIHTAYTNQK